MIVNMGYIRWSEETPLFKFISLFSVHLRHFDVSSTTSKKYVVDEAIEALAKRCNSLIRINLFGCFLLTDKSIRAISSCCPSLQVLNIGSCTAISDNGIKSLVACPQLLDLNLWHLELVTDKSLAVLAEKLKLLSTLVVSDCKNVTSGGLEKFSMICKVYF